MIKRLLILLFLSIFLIGCKTKKTVSTSKKTTTARVIKNEPQKNKSYSTKKQSAKKGIYELPEDTGKFVRFEIASVNEYIDTFSEIAQLEMKAYGIPASITLAQGLLESGFGKGKLAMKTNNHFGIKCHTGWTGDYDFHDDDEKGECFRKYNHPMYSYRDHSLFLANRSRYAFLFDLKSDDYKQWAKGLRQAGYATDKKYPQKLISLIEKYELYKYDGATIKTRNKRDAIVAKHKNGAKIHTVQKGDTLYSISKKYFISVDVLKRMNKIQGSGIAIGQKLILKPKKH